MPTRDGKPKPFDLALITQDVLDRFESKVDRTPGQGPKGQCHRWIGTFSNRKNKSEPYGVFKIKGRMVYAHRLAFIIAKGYDPTPLLICHSCDKPWCVNPECFFLGDTKANTEDSGQKGRRAYGLRNGKYTHPEKTPRGEKAGPSKFSDADTLMIFEWRKQGIPVKEIAVRLRVSWGAIYHVLQGRTRGHLHPKRKNIMQDTK
jgi:hypothetical protein